MPNALRSVSRAAPRIGAAAALLAVVAVSAGCLSSFQQGVRDYRAGNYDEAESRLNRSLERNDDDPRTRLWLAKTLVAREAYDEAIPHAERAMESDATRGPAARTLGKAHWELGQPVDAADAWRRARELDPELVSDDDFERALVEAIDVTRSRHEPGRRLKLLKQLRELTPDHEEVSENAFVETRQDLARSLVDDGSYKRAASLYAELQEETGRPKYAINRGRLYVQLGRQDEARKAFDSYVDHDEEGRVERLLEVARRSYQFGARRLALGYFEEAIDALPDSARYRRAQLRLKVAGLAFDEQKGALGREQIRRHLEEMRQLRGAPLKPEVYLSAVDTAENAGRGGFATDLLEEAVEKASPSWDLTSRLAERYAVRARRDDYEETLERYIDRSDATSDALEQAGDWAKGRRNYELAREYYERLTETSPDRPEVWRKLGRVYARLGQVDQMRRALDQFVQRQEGDVGALLDVASLYADKNLYDAAETALESARESAPQRLRVADKFAELYRKWGKPEEIVEVYRRWVEAGGGDPEDARRVANRLERRQKYDQAAAFFRRAAEDGINDAWLELADVRRAQRLDRDMDDALRRYLEAAGDRQRALREALERYRAASMHRRATDVLEELIELEPDSPNHYRDLGTTYLEQGRRRAAFDLWETYVDQSDRTVAAIERVVEWLGRQSQPVWVLEFLERWDLEDESEPKLYRLVGDAYLDLTPDRFRRPPRRPSRGPVLEDAREEANRYYEKYLRRAEPTRSELRSFADHLRQHEFWRLAAEAYTELVDSAAPGSGLQLHFAESMLRTGRTRRAVDAYETAYSARGEELDVAATIAGHLAEERHYRRAEPYYRRLLDSDDQSRLGKAFTELVEIYHRTDRSDEIPDLVTTFRDRAPNPTDARRTAVDVLESHGMYEQAARQIEQIRNFQGSVLGFRLGKNLYRAGEFERAAEAFQQFNEENPYGAAAWGKVARFYEKHASPERAAEAYDRAADEAPDDFDAYKNRAELALLQGDLEEGLRDFERALERVEANNRDDILRARVETLREIGHFARARQFAESALKRAKQHEGFFLKTVARGVFSSGDVARIDRTIDELDSSAVGLVEIVDMLVEHDLRRRAARLVESSLDSGNLSAAAEALAKHPDVLTRLGGMERLARAARPILRQQSGSSRRRIQLGDYFIRQGNYDEGLLYLRSVRQEHPATVRPMLAQTYALQGRPEEALDVLQRYLESLSPRRRTASRLRGLGLRLTLADQPELFDRLLASARELDHFGAPATQLEVTSALHAGEVDRAIDRTRRRIDAVTAGGTSSALGLESRQRLDEAVAGIEALAAANFGAEARQMLEQLRRRAGDSRDLRRLEFRLAARRGGEPLETLLDARREADVRPEPERRRWQAEVLMVNGDYELAKSWLSDNRGPRTPSHRSKDFRFQLGNAFASGAPRDRLRQLAESRMSESNDILGSRQRLGETFYRLGDDGRALKYARQMSKRGPTPSNLRRTLRAAVAAGNTDAARRTVTRLTRTADEAMGELKRIWEPALERADADVAGALLEPVAEAKPASLELQFGRATLAFRVGDVEEGRTILKSYLDSTDWSAPAVERVLEFLDEQRLPAESIGLIRETVDDQELTRGSLEYLGYANVALDRNDRGRSVLARAVEASPDSVEKAVEVARILFERDHPEVAEHFANRAVEQSPDRPSGRLYRGLARLRTGDIEAGRSDVDAGLQAGFNRFSALRDAGRSALVGGAPDLARDYLTKLVQTPLPTTLRAPMSPTVPVGLAFGAFRSAGAADEGMAFFEERFPSLATAESAAVGPILSQLSTLYEDAGLPERSFDLYRRGIARRLVFEPAGRGIFTYLNNLAYSYSTTDTHVDSGLDLARRAVAAARTREFSFLDTLGWLHYRKGNLATAERAIRSALSSSGFHGQGTPPLELYRHLATLREARGDDSTAFWLRRFTRTLDRPAGMFAIREIDN